jgi:hypothetical protein
MKLVELASVIRTKNAGPFELTIDGMLSCCYQAIFGERR